MIHGKIMKTKILDTNAIIKTFVTNEIKKHEYCFVFWYPGEDNSLKEVSKLINKELNMNDIDNKIIIVNFKNIDQMKDFWKKALLFDILSPIAYNKGKQITF